MKTPAPSMPVEHRLGRAPERVLIIRPSALGDVCRSVPVLASLRAHWPHATIDWLVQDTFAAAVREHPALGDPRRPDERASHAIEFPRARFGRWSPATTLELLRWLESLRRTRYDVVIDAQGLLRSGIFALWTRAPIRAGYRRAPELAWLGYNHRAEVGHERHEHAVNRMLALVESLGVAPICDMRLYTSAAANRFAADRVADRAPRFVVVAPTSRWEGKRWPAERHANVVRALLADRSLGLDGVAVVGSQHERAQVGPLLELAASDSRVVDLVGATSVETLMGVIERSSLVIASDSAALHMAVGFDRPIVALFGPTRVDLVGPFRRSNDVLQHIEPGDTMDHKNAAAGRLLMERIGIDEVLAAASSRLGAQAQ